MFVLHKEPCVRRPSPQRHITPLAAHLFKLFMRTQHAAGVRLSRRLSLTRDSNPGVHEVHSWGRNTNQAASFLLPYVLFSRCTCLQHDTWATCTHARSCAPQTPPLERMTASGEKRKCGWLLFFPPSLNVKVGSKVG